MEVTRTRFGALGRLGGSWCGGHYFGVRGSIHPTKLRICIVHAVPALNKELLIVNYSRTNEPTSVHSLDEAVCGFDENGTTAPRTSY